MTKGVGKLFHEQFNADGTLDLLCLVCRALVGENLSLENLPAVRETHRCRVWTFFVRR
jgi:hypothetical protein